MRWSLLLSLSSSTSNGMMINLLCREPNWHPFLIQDAFSYVYGENELLRESGRPFYYIKVGAHLFSINLKAHIITGDVELTPLALHLSDLFKGMRQGEGNTIYVRRMD